MLKFSYLINWLSIGCVLVLINTFLFKSKFCRGGDAIKLSQLHWDVQTENDHEPGQGQAASVGGKYESLCNTPQQERYAAVLRECKKRVAEVAEA